MREKYAEYVQEYVEGSVAGIEVGDLEPLFKEVVSNIKKEVELSKVVKSECQKGKHSKSHKQHKLYMYRCVETGESKTKPEWMQVLKCNEDRFKYLIKRRAYVKE